MSDLLEWPLPTRDASEYIKCLYAHPEGCRCCDSIRVRYLKARLLAKHKGVDSAGWPLRDAP